MELSKKTTILFPPKLHARLDAVRGLAALRLPVGTPARMKRQSVPKTEDLRRSCKEILPRAGSDR